MINDEKVSWHIHLKGSDLKTRRSVKEAFKTYFCIERKEKNDIFRICNRYQREICGYRRE